jgi:hypothetical protein
LPRVLGALSLRPRVFRDIALDRHAGLQADILVVLEGIIEASVDSAIHELPEAEMLLLGGWVLAAAIGWFFWAGIVWFVGSRLFTHEMDFPSVARAVALAHAPSLLYGIALVPGVLQWAGLVYAGALVWFTAAMFAAMRGIYETPPLKTAQMLLVALCLRVVMLEVVPYAMRIVPGT